MSKKVIKITIRRGIQKGYPFCDLLCDGKKVDHSISRALTGTTGESGYGVFGQHTDGKLYVDYGNTGKTFDVTPLDFATDAPEVIEKEIQKRIDAICTWVSGIDKSEEFSFALIGEIDE